MPDLTNVQGFKDIIGNLLVIGDVVAYKGFSTMRIGTIKHFSPKMVRVISNRGAEKSVYPHELVKPAGKNMELINSVGYCKRVMQLAYKLAASDDVSSNKFENTLFELIGIAGRGPEECFNATVDACRVMRQSRPIHQKRWDQEELMRLIKDGKR